MQNLPVHDPIGMRHAGSDLLSLALLDARNVTLRWLAMFEEAGKSSTRPPPARSSAASDTSPGSSATGRSASGKPAAATFPSGEPSALWLAGQAAWLQECWIGRHVQRQRGPRCDPFVPRLASIEPGADRWFRSPGDALPSHGEVRAYLADTLDTTLELLTTANEDDDGLYFFRLALWHEDRLAEVFAALAQSADLSHALQRDLWPAELTSFAARPELHVPALQWQLGSAPTDGHVPEAEKWAHAVDVPAFDIDAQPVTWSQYAEFVDDGGYDDMRWWTEAGRAWLEREGRRVPRHVEQLRNGVLLRRAGTVQRANPQQSAVHIAAHEADAWCRWAGRRLPTEAEWEVMALQGRSRGASWGSVNEWVMGSARTYPGHEAGPVPLADLQLAWPGDGRPALRVLRGASWLTAPRRRHPKARRFIAADDDSMFSGFRSCAY